MMHGQKNIKLGLSENTCWSFTVWHI